MAYEEHMETLACDICGKPPSVPLKECHGNWGRRNALCSGQKQCRILQKSAEQVDYVLSSTRENVFLKACPGSGKTEVVGLKAAHTIQNWRDLPGGIAVLTFTNNAADEIKQRVTQLAGVERAGYPHFIGTLDSWLHGYIANPFGHLRTGYEGQNGDRSIRIVDEYDNNPWLNAYKLDTPFLYPSGVPVPLYANKIRFDYGARKWEIKVPSSETNEYVIDEEYYVSKAFANFRNSKAWLTLEVMRKGFRQKKGLFNRAGFATYQDIENLCFEMLSDNITLCGRLARRFPFIIVDECQDLSWIQLNILEKLRGEGTTVHFVGDLNQAIYGFRKVDPQAVATFAKDKGFKELPLSSNFRSCQPIIDLCNRVVRDDSPDKSKCEQLVDRPCICVVYPKDQMPSLPDWFAWYLDQVSCSKTKSAIVARNWNNVSRLRPAENNAVKGRPKTLAWALFLWKSGCEQALDDSLTYMGRFIADTYFPNRSANARYHYCPQCVDSPLRWRLFLAGVLSGCCATGCPISELNQTWSNWSAIVRREFDRIVSECFWTIEGNLKGDPPRFGKVDRFKAPQGEGNNIVSPTLPSLPRENQGGNLRITTIHRVKGETLDALLLVSAQSAQGTKDGYWEQWLANPKSEAARLAYVASSRPKHLLAWAIPDTATKKDLAKITELGFHIVQMEVT